MDFDHKTLGFCKHLMEFGETYKGLDGKKFILVETHVFYEEDHGHYHNDYNSKGKLRKNYYILWGNLESDKNRMSVISCFQEKSGKLMNLSQSVRKFHSAIKATEHVDLNIREL